jgi:hypothetical protein
VQEILETYRLGAAWLTTAGLFLLARLFLRLRARLDICASISLASVAASLFAFLFPHLNDAWSFAVFGSLVFPLGWLRKFYRNKKMQGKNGVWYAY